jgi:hypothetical protein
LATPLPYDEAIARAVCDRIAAGESLRSICDGGEDIPCERTIYRWLAASEDFSQEYARARKTWADAQIEEVIAIARNTELKPDDKRVQIDTLKWAMGKLNGKYSDKLKHVGGDEGDAPIRTVTGIEWTIVTPEA